MEALGDQFLAGPSLADDQDRAVERRRAARPLHRVEECKALADELIRSLHALTVGGKSHQLARFFALFSRQNCRFSQKISHSLNMAQDLNGDRQV